MCDNHTKKTESGLNSVCLQYVGRVGRCCTSFNAPSVSALILLFSISSSMEDRSVHKIRLVGLWHILMAIC